jgi:sec-independent protein translocase protein TatA
MFDVGVPELVMILVVALIVFGPGKLPEVGASLGKAMRDFRNATQGISDEIQSVTRLAGPPESEADMRARLQREQQAKVEAAVSSQPQVEMIPRVPAPVVGESSIQASTAPAAPAASTAEPVVASESPEPSSF